MVAFRVLEPMEVPSSLAWDIDEMRAELPPGWRVVVLEVEGDLVVTGEPVGYQPPPRRPDAGRPPAVPTTGRRPAGRE